MSEKDETKLEVIDGGKQTTKDEPKKKATKQQKVKKLTGTQLKNKANEAREIQRINLEVGGDKYYYEIDTRATTTRQADFIQNIKYLTAYTSTEQAFESFNEEETSRFMASMILAELMHIFSSLEVGETIEEKVSFIATLNDLNILQAVSDNIPEGLFEVIKVAEESISELVDELVAEAEEIQKRVIDLEKIKIENTETEGE